ncbi:MAG TPA: nitroreductase family deazaflavin-dependent oxidoreductase, partial [Anaerolineae bacterium]|nr:nitroreductase family deazaflavin-dependent oxidoreductase [Anaerolineae bacterium]
MPIDQKPNTHKPSISLPYPSGLSRLLMRFPIWLYRFKLGWLLGKRFLLLEHRGRNSGMIRQAVIEVVDQDPQKGSYVVAAAWGRQSDWYKNIEAEPQVKIRVGRQRFPAFATTLSADDAAQHLSTYATKHPIAFRHLGSLLMGSRSHDTMQIMESFIEAIPFVEFV